MTYKKLLIQQQTFDGSTYTNVGSVKDTYVSFGVVCQEFPFKHLPETKDIPKHDWFDEDGEDAYIPKSGLKFKAYDLEAKFLYSKNLVSIWKYEVAAMHTSDDYPTYASKQMASDIKAFIDFICGKDADGKPLLAIYDEYTRTGRQGVYVVSVDSDLYFYDDVNNNVIAQFKIKFRVTDPVTDITLTT